MLKIRTRSVFFVISLLAPFALATPAIGQQIATSGIGAYIPQGEVVTELPDGRSQVSVRMGGYLKTDDPEDPNDLVSQDCAATNIVGADGTLQVSGGHCAAQDPDGDMYWISFWNTLEGGEWSMVGGTGKFEGVTGGGTSTTLAAGGDGRSLIRWEGTITLR